MKNILDLDLEKIYWGGVGINMNSESEKMKLITINDFEEEKNIPSTNFNLIGRVYWSFKYLGWVY